MEWPGSFSLSYYDSGIIKKITKIKIPGSAADDTYLYYISTITILLFWCGENT
jgi:hypothetical protein